MLYSNNLASTQIIGYRRYVVFGMQHHWIQLMYSLRVHSMIILVTQKITNNYSFIKVICKLQSME